MSNKAPFSSPAYDLIPDSIVGSIPGIGYTVNEPLVTAYLKWFTPDAGWTWYVTELDLAKGICYGVVVGLETEWGTFSLQEVQQMRDSLRLPVERDLHLNRPQYLN